MTKAFVRKCNICSKVFLKESGCNQITCRCGNIQCYLCGVNVQADHSHFGEPEDGKGCPLFGEELLNEQVVVAQERTVQELLKNEVGLEDDDIRVDKHVVTNTLNPPVELHQHMAAPVADFIFRPVVVPVQRQVYYPQVYGCTRCFRDFYSAQALSQHREAKHTRFRKTCGICGKSFQSSQSLAQHTTDKHVTECRRCGKGFRSENALVQHSRDKHGYH